MPVLDTVWYMWNEVRLLCFFAVKVRDTHIVVMATLLQWNENSFLECTNDCI